MSERAPLLSLEALKLLALRSALTSAGLVAVAAMFLAVYGAHRMVHGPKLLVHMGLVGIAIGAVSLAERWARRHTDPAIPTTPLASAAAFALTLVGAGLAWTQASYTVAVLETGSWAEALDVVQATGPISRSPKLASLFLVTPALACGGWIYARLRGLKTFVSVTLAAVTALAIALGLDRSPDGVLTLTGLAVGLLLIPGAAFALADRLLPDTGEGPPSVVD